MAEAAARPAELAQPALEELLRRAVAVGGFPVAWLSLFEAGVERVRARAGVTFAELAAERSFALHGAGVREPLFVEDAARSAWQAHPLVVGKPRARFIGVVPLRSGEAILGSLTVLDTRPRVVARSERTALENLASLAVARLEASRPAAPAAGALLAQERSQRQAALERLEGERQFTEAVLENVNGAFFLVSADGVIVRWNSSLAAAVGYAEGEIAAMHPADFFSAADRELVREAMQEVFEHGRERSFEAEIVDRAGNVRPYLVSARPARLGERTYLIGVARDITLRRRAEQQMVRAKERLDLALASSRLALWDWDLARDRVYFDENWSLLLGEAPRESTYPGSQVKGWVHPDDREVFLAAVGNARKGVSDEFDCEYRVANAAGDWMWMHARGKVIERDGARAALRMTGTCADITKRKQAEERADWLATRDPLTGLPNRALLHDRLEQAVTNAARHRAAFAFMFIDLDRFKTINDSLGHHVGDLLLKEVAARLESCVRASDTVARLGGDEFAVILEDLADGGEAGARQVADKMVAAMAAPLAVEGQALNTSCSIGIGLYPADGRDSATLMKNADVAMYCAKEKGRNNYQFFSAGMNARVQERISLETWLRQALKRNELVLHYQPRLRVDGRSLVGVEALIRWQHPRRGLLMPSKFMDVAEESGLIMPIGEWALEAACAQAAAWQRRLPGLRLSVNLSAGQAADGERLFRAVEGALGRSGLEATSLELEITETHLMRDLAEKAQLLQRLGALGARIAIDDFGTGYSSLAHLKQLPVDAIKIDGTFVRSLLDDPGNEAIVRAILAMAHSLRLTVVAEGVETPAQLDALRSLGCDEYQGYLDGEPLAAADFESRFVTSIGNIP